MLSVSNASPRAVSLSTPAGLGVDPRTASTAQPLAPAALDLGFNADSFEPSGQGATALEAFSPEQGLFGDAGLAQDSGLTSVLQSLATALTALAGLANQLFTGAQGAPAADAGSSSAPQQAGRDGGSPARDAGAPSREPHAQRSQAPHAQRSRGHGSKADDRKDGKHAQQGHSTKHPSHAGRTPQAQHGGAKPGSKSGSKPQDAAHDTNGLHGVGVPGSTNKSKLEFAKRVAHKFGLTITSTTGGQHAPGSYHYKGRAIDVAGPRDAMARYFKFFAHYKPTELFYDPLGGIKNGQRIGAIGGHNDHVHVAF